MVGWANQPFRNASVRAKAGVPIRSAYLRRRPVFRGGRTLGGDLARGHARTLTRPWRFMRHLDGMLHDGLGDGFLGHASLRYERGKRCNDDMARVDLKKAAKRCTRVAAAKPIGAERGEWGLDIGCYQLRTGAHIVCCGNDGPCHWKTAGAVPRLPLIDRVQPVSSFDLTRVARKLGES